MSQPEKENLIEQWLQGNLTEEELLQSMSQEEVDQYKTILNTVDSWIPEGSESIQPRLGEVLSAKKEAKVISISRRAWVASIAASIALIAAITFLFIGDQSQEYYAENENMEIMLPDGTTKVILSPGSTLSFKNFQKQNRRVRVKGRAYFDVTEKGAFDVEYEGGGISVLGTQFELVNFDGLFEASCFEGSVEVNYRGKRAKMKARDRVTYVRGGLEKSTMNRTNPGWLDGEEQFENAQLIKVIRIIETRYKVSISTDQITLDRRFTGNIPLNNLDQACLKVFSSLGINYTIDGDRIILTP